MNVQSVLKKYVCSRSYALIKILSFFIFVTITEPDDPFTSKHIYNVENDEDTTTTAVTL